MTPPNTMQALLFETAGAPLRLTELPTPRPEPGQALVRIAASGVNPLDIKIRAGAAGHARQPPPAVLGLDLAGVVATLGPDVFREGYEVLRHRDLEPRYLYRPAVVEVRGVDVKTVKGLAVGYVAGIGDEVPRALEQLGADQLRDALRRGLGLGGSDRAAG